MCIDAHHRSSCRQLSKPISSHSLPSGQKRSGQGFMWKLLTEAYITPHRPSNKKRRPTHGGTSKEIVSIHLSSVTSNLIFIARSKAARRKLPSVYCVTIFVGISALGDVDVEELLERQRQQVDGGECHHFVNKS
jgi:hypothetical protein